MASVQTTKYDGRYLKLTVWEDSYNFTTNESTVKWKLESIGGSHDYYSIYNWGVWVNNSTIYAEQDTSYSSHNFPAATGTRNGSIKVRHNADGSASSVPFKLKGTVYYDQSNTYSGNISLTQANRKPSYTSVDAIDITDTSVRLTGIVDTKTLSVTDGGWDLSTDGGSTWTYYSGDPTDKTITGLIPGTQYWYRGYVVTAGGGSNSSWGTFTTTDYAVKQKINGNWETCVPYVKANDTWKKAIPYIKVNDTWKQGIN